MLAIKIYAQHFFQNDCLSGIDFWTYQPSLDIGHSQKISCHYGPHICGSIWIAVEVGVSCHDNMPCCDHEHFPPCHAGALSVEVCNNSEAVGSAGISMTNPDLHMGSKDY